MNAQRQLALLLIRERRRELRSQPQFWPWLHPYKRGSIPRKPANKYLLYCLLDYQMQPGTAERNVRRFVDDTLHDPDDLWGTIRAIPASEWDTRFSVYRLHRFGRAHRKVRTIAEIVVRDFGSDARLLWASKDPRVTLENLERRLTLGPQLSRMTVLGLLENRLLAGDGDVKADLRVRRVLGRVLRGREFTIDETGAVQTEMRKVKPRQPWKLDLPLYQIGYDYCWSRNPACDECPLSTCCKYAGS